jgi:hypothetical protein
VKKYDPDSKETDAEWLRGVILTGLGFERAQRDRARLLAIADRLEALDKGVEREAQHPNQDLEDVLDRGLPNQLDDHFGEIDFVAAKRFVGLLREAADWLDEVRDEDYFEDARLSLVIPRLREAATRIEKATEIVGQWQRIVPAPFPSLARKLARILDGKPE